MGITFLAATVATATRILGTIFSFNWIHNDPTVTNSHRCFLQDLFRGDGVDIFELSLLLGPIFSNRKAHLLTNGCLFRWITLFRSQTCKFPPRFQRLWLTRVDSVSLAEEVAAAGQAGRQGTSCCLCQNFDVGVVFDLNKGGIRNKNSSSSCSLCPSACSVCGA